VHFLNVPEAKELKHNEEHLVVQSPYADQFQIGDLVYALPAHICPTVAAHSQLQVIEGGQATTAWPVDARDRLYCTD
jgi:D-serine deaminase-like pyridoxal phosphate-dependent protein